MVPTLSRSGGASKAAERGVSERVFQGHGRWQNTTAKDGYVKDNIVSRLSVSKSLGLYPLVVSHFQAVTLSSSFGFHPIFTLVMLRQCAAESSKIDLMVYFSGICCMVKLK